MIATYCSSPSSSPPGSPVHCLNKTGKRGKGKRNRRRGGRTFRRGPHGHSPSSIAENFQPNRNRKRCGVIGFYHDEARNEFSYVFVNKRYSIGYLEILLGHYQLDDLGLLVRLVEDTTLPERQNILYGNFAELYVNFWGRWDPTHKEKFRLSRAKFEALRVGYYQNHYFYSWERLLSAAHSQYTEPVKEFPKGRKKKGQENESDFDCAIREFAEETKFQPSSYVLVPYTKPFVMKVIGMDGLTYENIFYIVKFHNKENMDTRHSSETTGATWLTYEEALKQIRPHEEPQRDLLERIHSHLRGLYIVQ